ncbi:host nuclease inhibitor GamL [Rouxiella sp. Mn2063]|uniref:host nuclease inhibitor GamL n=1 Tax=Rouxiella sp. Mn2063 TaxID=3395262 RepID=UPI003BD78AE4
MNAYLTQDRLEQKRWDVHQAGMDKDEWIIKRADELTKEFPEKLSEFTNPFKQHTFFFDINPSQKVKEAYENLIWEICEAEATEQYSMKLLMGEL